MVLGRPIAAVRRAEGVAWFRFEQLCDGPRGADDYIEVARCFHTVLLSEVPVIGPASATGCAVSSAWWTSSTTAT